MIEVRAGRTRLEAHPLLLLLPMLAAALGLGAEATATMLALLPHECAHLLAARLVGARVSRMKLTPFGGAARVDNLYVLSPAAMFAVAAAGPAANLACGVLAAALAHWGALSPAAALLYVRVNAALMLFNLLPALPLDGGRMLFALSEKKLGRDRALSLGLLFGRIAAALLCVGALWGWARTGRLNLSLPFAAVFLFAGTDDERTALSDSRADAMLRAVRPPTKPVPARLVAVGSACAAREALSRAPADAPALYAVYEGTALAGFADERALVEAALRDPAAHVRDALPSQRTKEGRRCA